MHCYWSRANLGPVWYGDMENLRWIQENLDWHQLGIFSHILWNTHRSIIFHVWLGKIMFEQLGYSLQKSEDILTGHQYFSPFSTQLFHLGLSVVCSVQDAKITHIKCEIFKYRNVEFHGICHSILTHEFPICAPRCHVCSYTITAFTSFYQNFFVLQTRWLIAKYNLLEIMLAY